MGNRFFGYFLDCSNDLGLISKEDIGNIRKGEDLDKYVMKIALSLVNLFGNMRDIRHEPTLSAINFIRSVSSNEYNINNMLRKRAKFTCIQDSDDEEGEIVESKKRRVESTVHNERFAEMKHELSSSVRVSQPFNLEDFVSIFIDDTDDIFPEFDISETPNLDDLGGLKGFSNIEKFVLNFFDK